MTDRLLNAGWLLSCIGLWVALARDPLTILLCAGITVPYTILAIIEQNGHIARSTVRD